MNDRNASLRLENHRRLLLPNLESYRRPIPPSPPPSFRRMTEEELISELKRARGLGEKASTADRQMLEWFGKWREGVMKAETKAEANILLILRVAFQFHAADDYEATVKLLDFLQEYGITIDIPVADDRDRVLLARRYSRCRGAMSDALLAGGVKVSEVKERPRQVAMDESLTRCFEKVGE